MLISFQRPFTDYLWLYLAIIVIIKIILIPFSSCYESHTFSKILRIIPLQFNYSIILLYDVGTYFTVIELYWWKTWTLYIIFINQIMFKYTYVNCIRYSIDYTK